MSGDAILSRAPAPAPAPPLVLILSDCTASPQVSANELRLFRKVRHWLSKRRKAGAGIRDVVEPLLDCLNNDRLPHEHIFYEYIRRAALNLNRKSLADARWGTPPLPLPLHAYTSKR